MNMKLLAEAAAIATGVGLSTLTSGAGFVHAAPSNQPPPCFNCQLGPGGPGSPVSPDYHAFLAPGTANIIPRVGGGPKAGGRSVVQPGIRHPAPAAH
jgi:hypothetical protein